jgi:hypothetical protein
MHVATNKENQLILNWQMAKVSTYTCLSGALIQILWLVTQMLGSGYVASNIVEKTFLQTWHGKCIDNSCNSYKTGLWSYKKGPKRIVKAVKIQDDKQIEKTHLSLIKTDTSSQSMFLEYCTTLFIYITFYFMKCIVSNTEEYFIGNKQWKVKKNFIVISVIFIVNSIELLLLFS